MSLLPREIRHVVIPPIKCQGIKSKLVPFIAASISWDGTGRWVEPFLGSGVVAFNVQPERAYLSDSNPHIITLYQRIHDGKLTPKMVRAHLTREGAELLRAGEEHYYAIRERFNRTSDPLDFLFLNRSCFNGVMRFNRKGEFNTPFCRKPDRFRPALVTKIVNQIAQIARVMYKKDWEFHVGDWRDCLYGVRREDFVYLDPPYIGRHTDYFDSWTENDAIELARTTHALPCGYALSMWKENKYRTNEYVDAYWSNDVQRTFKHFYHVGSTEDLRNEMEEVLVIREGFDATDLMEGGKSLQMVLTTEE
jgi:DNA adenine methylase